MSQVASKRSFEEASRSQIQPNPLFWSSGRIHRIRHTAGPARRFGDPQACRARFQSSLRARMTAIRLLAKNSTSYGENGEKKVNRNNRKLNPAQLIENMRGRSFQIATKTHFFLKCAVCTPVARALDSKPEPRAEWYRANTDEDVRSACRETR